MNKQEIFDKVYLGLKSQGFQQSVTDFGSDPNCLISVCQYRGEEGRKCAVGWLIPDEAYSANLEKEGSIRCNDLLIETLKTIGIREEYTDFLSELQSIHDSFKYPDEMQANYDRYAKDHKLTVPQDLSEQDLEQIIDVIDVYNQTDWGSQI